MGFICLICFREQINSITDSGVKWEVEMPFNILYLITTSDAINSLYEMDPFSSYMRYTSYGVYKGRDRIN